MSDTEAPTEVTEQEFIYRATYADGRVYETQPRRYRRDQPSFVGIAQLLARKRDPGLTAIRLVRDVPDGEWVEA
jgi:hypothetical protein